MNKLLKPLEFSIPQSQRAEFRKELVETNYYRSRSLGILLFIFFAILLVTDFFNYQNGLWDTVPGYRFLFYSHLFLVIELIIIFSYSFFLKLDSDEDKTRQRQIFTIAFSFLTLLGAAFTSIADQFIHGELTVFILSSFLFAIINYHRPLTNVIIYSLVYITLITGITYAQTNEEILRGHYLNTTAMVIVALFLAGILYHSRVKNFISRKTIEHQNHKLEKTNLELSATNKELQESLMALDESQNIIFSLTVTLESKDRNTHGHSQRVANYVVALAEYLGLDEKDKMNLWRAAILHDLGKIGIPDAILNKPLSLTGEEWGVVKSHPERGEAICSRLKFAREILPIIRHHHERYDGKGYPDGLCGEEIPFLSRIVSIADTVDAITSPRSYRPQKKTMEEAIEELKRCSGTQFDPKLVDAFVKVYELDFLGLMSESTGDTCDFQ